MEPLRRGRGVPGQQVGRLGDPLAAGKTVGEDLIENGILGPRRSLAHVSSALLPARLYSAASSGIISNVRMPSSRKGLPDWKVFCNSDMPSLGERHAGQRLGLLDGWTARVKSPFSAVAAAKATKTRGSLPLETFSARQGQHLGLASTAYGLVRIGGQEPGSHRQHGERIGIRVEILVQNSRACCG